MKLIYILLLLISAAAFSQRIDADKFDIVTGDTFINVAAESYRDRNYTDDIALGYTYYVFMSSKYQRTSGTKSFFVTLDISNEMDKPVCLQKINGKIDFILENGTPVSCPQISATDCKVENVISDFYLGSTFEQQLSTVNLLANEKIKTINLYTNDGIVSIEVIKRKRKYIKAHFALLLKKYNMKTVNKKENNN